MKGCKAVAWKLIELSRRGRWVSAKQKVENYCEVGTSRYFNQLN